MSLKERMVLALLGPCLLLFVIVVASVRFMDGLTWFMAVVFAIAAGIATYVILEATRLFVTDGLIGTFWGYVIGAAVCCADVFVVMWIFHWLSQT